MEMFTTAYGTMIWQMDLEFIFIHREQSMKEFGKMTHKMETVKSHGRMELCFKGIMLMEKRAGKGL
jgi:hypothetical protein